MTLPRPVALPLLALACAPALASGQAAPIDYTTGDYQYAEPLPEGAPPAVVVEEPHGAARVIPARAGTPVVFTSRPVVQPIESVDPNAYSAAEEDLETGGGYAEVETATAAPYRAEEMPRSTAAPVYAHDEGAPRYAYVYQGAGPQVPPGGQLVQFDRAAWLDECSRRIAPQVVYEDGDGEVYGALAGAAVGGLVGNRVAGRGHRTTGTLVGAGLGALAGAAIGDAVDDRRGITDDDSRARCEDYLDGYMRSAQSGALRDQYSESGQYMLVPVTVMVPYHAIYEDGTPVRRTR